MPSLAGLSGEEKRTLIHMLSNKTSEDILLDSMLDDSNLKKLAELSETENHALKNRYRHQRRTMDFADSKKMPIDERKVKDMLRNQHIFRNKADKEIGTYQANQDSVQLENGIMTYLNEAAHGDMRALLNDVGMNRDQL